MLKVIVPPWLGLGFYRGVIAYNHKYKCDLIDYEKEPNHKLKPTYFYASSFGSGLFGILIYANPFFLPSTISKEIYRIEINLRGLDEEKKKNDFYKII